MTLGWMAAVDAGAQVGVEVPPRDGLCEALCVPADAAPAVPARVSAAAPTTSAVRILGITALRFGSGVDKAPCTPPFGLVTSLLADRDLVSRHLDPRGRAATAGSGPVHSTATAPFSLLETLVSRGDGRLSHDLDPTDRPPKDACGVFGAWAPGEDVAKLAYYGLYALQHRGQEAAGIAVSDGSNVVVYKELGLVSQVFDEVTLNSLTGHLAVGHCRYSTTGSCT